MSSISFRLVSITINSQIMDKDIDDFQSTHLVNKILARRTYLVSFYQTDLAKFPARKGFGKRMKIHFNIGSGRIRVQHQACSQEKYQDGVDHYHVALQLTWLKRWKSVNDLKISREDITVNFSGHHDNSHFVYKYICKQGESVEYGKNHPDLDNVASRHTKLHT